MELTFLQKQEKGPLSSEREYQIMKNAKLKMQDCDVKISLLHLIIISLISVVLFSGRLFADVEEEIPEYKTKEVLGTIGYRLLNIDGYGGKLLEYDYLHSSATGGIDYSYYTPLLKLYLEGGYLNPKDYSLRLDGRYKDLLWMKLSVDSLFHNLDHERLSPPSSDGVLRSQDLNPQDNYGLQYRESKAFVKVKMPDYPAHLILEGRILDKEGLTQQKFVNENCITQCHRISYSRDIDWITKEFNIGLNGHLGPVELAYIHNIKTFEDKGEIPTFNFGPSFDYRPAGTFEHNKNPKLSLYSDTFKAHTSYTGRIVASGTYTKGKRENETSGGHVDYRTGAGDFTWVPFGMLTIALKFRHLDLDIDNPDTITVSNREGTFNKTFSVRPPISSKKNTANLILTWRPMKGVSLRAEYERSETERDNMGITPDTWRLPDKSIEDNIKISTRVRANKTLNLRASYKYKHIDDPPYENQSSKIHEGTGVISWNPLTILGFSINYRTLRGEETVFERELISGSLLRAFPIERDNSQNNLSLLFNITPVKDLSLNANYSYFSDRITNDLLYGGDFLNSITKENYVLKDENVPYKAKSHAFSLGGTLRITKNLNISAEARRAHSEGEFNPNILTSTNTFSGSGPLTVNTSGIGDFSVLDIVQKSLSMGVEYRFKEVWIGKVSYIYRSYDDRREDSLDGDVNIIYLTLSKKW